MKLPGGENPFTELSSEVVYERKYVRFIKDMVRIGEVEKDYSYADIADGIAIVAVNDKREVVLVGQWRYPIKQYTWEVPAGMRDEGEDPLETAKRELEEEAGIRAKKWTPLGSFFMEASSTTKRAFAFLAQDLELVEQSIEEDERIEIEWLPFDVALEKIATGEIRDGLTVIGLLRARDYLLDSE